MKLFLSFPFTDQRPTWNGLKSNDPFDSYDGKPSSYVTNRTDSKAVVALAVRSGRPYWEAVLAIEYQIGKTLPVYLFHLIPIYC